MAKDNKRPVDDTVDRWRENPIQEESDRIFNHASGSYSDNPGNTENTGQKKDFFDKLTERAEDKLDKQYANKEDQRKAELDELNAAENKFGYRRPGDQQPTTPRRRFAQLLNKKNAIRGGIAGGGVGITLALFGFLTPFKIPGIMETISDEAGQRVEQIVTHRAKIIIARAIMEKIGIPGSGPVITGDGPLSSLIATLRTNKFEEALKAKGLEFVKEGKSVSLKQNGKFIGRNLKNEAEIVKIIDSQVLSRDALRTIVKENIPIWQVFKRAKFAKWLRLKYNIPRYGVTETKAADVDENARIRAGQEIETGAQRQARAVDEMLTILKGADKPDEGLNGQATRDRAGASLKERIAANSEAVKGVLDGRSAVEVDAIMREVTNTIAKESLQKVGSKVIPVYGWITGIATLVVAADYIAVHGTDGTAARTMFVVTAVTKAVMFGDMSGIASQLKLGALPQDDIDYYSNKLTGAEESQAMNCIQKQWSTGCDKVGLADTSGVSERNPKWFTDYLAFFKSYTGVDLKNVAEIAHNSNPVILLARGIFWLDNALWGVAGNAIIWFMQHSLPANVYGLFPQSVRDGIEGVFTSFANNVFGYMLQMFGLSVNPFARGAELVNIMFSGADFAFNENCIEMLGCHELSTAQANLVRTQYLAEKRDEIRSKGTLYALFSPDVTSSLTTQLAINLPSQGSSIDVMGTASKLARFSTSSLSTIGSVLSPSAAAIGEVSTESISGSIPRGLSPEELDMPVSHDALATGQCAPVVEGRYDPCTGDSHIIQAMICGLDQNKIETPECNPDADSGSDSLQPNGTCPAETTLVPKITKGWERSGKERAITLCSIPGTSAQVIPDWKDSRYEGTSAVGINEVVVNSEAAESLRDAAKKAKASGVTLSISVGYRSLYEQCSIYIRNHARPSVCPGWITPVSGNWSTDVTYSNHMMGYSIDTLPVTESWMRRCVKDATDTKVDNRCFNFYDDVYQNQNWDSAHFTYKP